MFVKVDFLTNKNRWENGKFGLAFLIELRKSDNQKSRTYGGKMACQENDFWQKRKNNSL
jgi:hypothetical protein